jgi:hypothetical protein
MHNFYSFIFMFLGGSRARFFIPARGWRRTVDSSVVHQSQGTNDGQETPAGPGEGKDGSDDAAFLVHHEAVVSARKDFVLPI